MTSGLSASCVRDADGRGARSRARIVSDTLARVLKSAPDWNALPVDVPPLVSRVNRALPGR